MREYQGKWRSKKYPSKLVCGTLLITQLVNAEQSVTQIEMRYGGMLKGCEPMQLEHKGELPPVLEIDNEDGRGKLHFEVTECRTQITGRYVVEHPTEDAGVFSLERTAAPAVS